MNKLKKRDIKCFEKYNGKAIDNHPLFVLTKGDIECWEKI
jgi:hypothetical protein